MTPRLVKPIAGGSSALDGGGSDEVSKAAAQSLAEKVKQEFSVQRAARTKSSSSPRQTLTLTASGQPGEKEGRQLQPVYAHLDDDGDERMPIPSTWRPTPPAPAQPPSWVARQIKAGLLGFALGLAAVIPSVLWLTGHFGARPDLASMTNGLIRAPTQRDVPNRIKAASATSPATLIVTPQAAVKASAPTPEPNNQAAIESLLARAREMISDGNMLRARSILDDPILAENPDATFVLAETFDPNILAATGTREVRAEVERARMLYGKALAGGVEAARNRLQGLN